VCVVCRDVQFFHEKFSHSTLTKSCVCFHARWLLAQDAFASQCSRPTDWTMANNKRKQPEFTADDTKAVISSILEECEWQDGEFGPARGAISSVARQFECDKSTISRIWKKAKKNGEIAGACRASPQKSNRGRARICDPEEMKSSIASLRHNERRTIRQIAGLLDVSPKTVWRCVRVDKVTVPHTSTLAAHLADENKLSRFVHAADEVCCKPSGGFFFKEACQDVHLDEKWFFLTEQQLRVCLASGEVPKQRNARHKSHVVKVMFLAALARPRCDNDGNCTFDGKIGVWPFVEHVAAERTSVNRVAGTMETKCISATLTTCKRFFFEKVVPAVKAKFPRTQGQRRTTVRFQHDNPATHFQWFDPDWVDCWFENRQDWNFELKPQSANSCDQNMLDLGFFRALQSLQWKQPAARTIDEPVANANASFDAHDPDQLNKVWLTHQQCMDETIKCLGGNDCKIPHMGKDRPARHGQLPKSVPLTVEAIEKLEEANLLP